MNVPDVLLGSSKGVGDGPDVSEIIKPVRSYLLSSSPESEIFTGAATNIDVLAVLEFFDETDVEPGFSSWIFVDCFDNDKILKYLVTA